MSRDEFLRWLAGAVYEQGPDRPKQRAVCDFVRAALPRYAEPIPSPSAEQVERAYAFTLAAAAIGAEWPGANTIRGIVSAGRHAARASGDIDQIVFWEVKQARKDRVLGNYTTAIEIAQQAIRLSDRNPLSDPAAQEIRDHQVAAALLCASGAQLDLSDYDAARRTLTRLFELCGDRDSMLTERAAGLGGECQLELETGRIDRARAAAERQLEFAIRANSVDYQAEAIGRAMNLDLAVRQFAQAIERCEVFLRSEVGSKVTPATRAELEIRKGQAACEIQRDDGSRAQDTIDILTVALREPSVSEHMRAFGRLALADSFLLAGRFAESKASLDEVATAIASNAAGARALPVVIACRLASLRVALELVAPGTLGVTSEILSRELDEAIERMFAEWERRRASARVLPFLNWKEHRDLLAARIAMSAHAPSTAADRDADLALLVRAQEHGSLAESIGEKGASLAVLRERLVGPNGILLIYLPAVSGSFVFAIDDREVHRFPLPSSRVLDDAAHELARALSQSPSLRAESDRPWERPEFVALLLPDELQSLLRDRHEVTIVGFDLLGGLPFEALVVNGRPLGISHAVTLSPSVPVSLALARRVVEIAARSTEFDVCALDRPRSPGNAGSNRSLDLGSDESMRETLNSCYGAARIAWFAGLDATVEHLNEPARILQVFAHGLFEDEDEGVRIALAPSATHPDGRLSRNRIPSGIPGLILQMSCSAAFGPLARGEDGLSHFGGAWIEAGAATVVLPSRDVSVVATQRFLEHFHTALAGRGASPAEAARAARESLASDPRFSDPYFHALIHVYGHGREAVVAARTPERRREWNRWLLGGIVGIAFFLIRVVRRAATARSR